MSLALLRKIKLSRRVLTALFLALAPGLLAGLGIQHIGGRPYVSLDEFLKASDKFKSEWNPLTLKLDITYEEKLVRMEIGAPYYISDGYQYQLQYGPTIQNNVIYLPRELVEELFTEFQLPIQYRFKENKVATIPKAAPTADQKKSPDIAPRKAKLDFIVIDPGHGGKDPGAFGVSSIQEKEITLKVSQHLYYHLKKAFPETSVYITRFDDRFITLEGRAEIANRKLEKHGFGIYISIHCNSALTNKVHGYEIFYLAQNPSSEEARQVMLRENALVNGEGEVALLESFLLDSQLIAESKVLARQMDGAFRGELNGTVSSRGVRRADFAVLRHSLMPAILLEMGYISNSAEANMLQSKKFRDKLSAGVEEGIREFMKNRPGIN